ncbi:CoA binding domain-containing protein [Boletus edulis BED1]|uniref:CoA binding domain-containing protein n=1 Tax=Boletus edulis BED1 TaxID=1328754 RepID=A0AAD4C0Q7_BOLED|nr:CoA binding domain-containing protein [Boletus edulis BED1]
MATSVARQKFFLTHKKYAVVGASTDQSKWGTKILQWYIARDKDVTPVHPTNSELEGRKTVKSIDELASPTETALSIITPAKLTIKLLEQAKAKGIPAIWIQPGASDKDCVDYITNNEMTDYVLWQGECLWRDGDGILRTMDHERSSM